MNAEARLRAAAAALAEAWADAHAAGYRAVWPSQPADLVFLAISETGAVVPPVEKPAPKKPKQFPAD
jgi:hypothetical protein